MTRCTQDSPHNTAEKTESENSERRSEGGKNVHNAVTTPPRKTNLAGFRIGLAGSAAAKLVWLILLQPENLCKKA